MCRAPSARAQGAAVRSPRLLSIRPLPRTPRVRTPHSVPVTAHATSLQCSQQYAYTEVSDYSDLGWRDDDFNAHYVKGKLLGSGSFGQVYLGVDLATVRSRHCSRP